MTRMFFPVLFYSFNLLFQGNRVRNMEWGKGIIIAHVHISGGDFFNGKAVEIHCLSFKRPPYILHMPSFSCTLYKRIELQRRNFVYAAII